MKEIIKSKLFIVSAVVIAAVTFTAALNASRVYQSSVDFILIPRDAATAAQMDTLANNAQAIPKTLSFYDDMAAANDQIGGRTIHFPQYSSEGDWASKIATARLDSTSIIQITVSDADQTQAQFLSSDVALNLARKLSLFYDAKTELDSRALGSPITVYQSPYNMTELVLISVVAGFIITLIAFIISDFLTEIISRSYFWSAPKIKMPDFSRKVTPKESKEAESYIFQAEIKKPTKPDWKIKLPEPEVKPEAKPEVQAKAPVSRSAKAAAPDNLPIADEASIFKMSPTPKETDVSQDNDKRDESRQDEMSKPIISKATPEEVRERLNKLLSGKY